MSPLHPRTAVRATAAVLAAAAAVTGLAACSGDDPAPAAARPSTRKALTYSGVPAMTWTKTVCDGISAWQAKADTVATGSAEGGDAKALDAQFREPVGDLATATRTLAKTVADAGHPATVSGEAVQLQVSPLTAQLDDAATVLEALVSGPVTDAADARTRWTQTSSVVTTADRGVRTAMRAVGQLEPSGVLGRALATTPSCAAVLKAS
ncbi:MAG: hypothetical protein U0Q15_05810 [Kineosporiaceae bacterium]